MQSTLNLSKFPIPWGNAAGSGLIRPIPTGSQVNVTPGAASLTDGFPALNTIPIAAGGVPPFAQDMNGILNIITAWLQWYQAGGPIAYDATFQTSIGGYPSGARVLSRVTPGAVWRSTVENNTTNPDAGGAGWVADTFGRLLNVRSFLSAGTFTYVPTTATSSIIVTCLGGGGAGAGASVAGASGTYAVGSGGASGSVARSLLRSGFTGASIVVGAGGSPNSGGTGNPGGTSSFGSLLSAPGGGGGNAATLPFGQIGYANQALPGGVGVGGNLWNSSGQAGFCGLLQGIGPMSGPGAPSIFGGGGGNTSVGTPGATSTPGAGGGGAGATTQSPGPFPGSPGHDGAVLIEEYS